MNALIEFTTLTRSHPGPDAPTEQVAAWYEAKGRLHEHLAATVGPVEAAGELAYAAAAYEHARRLTRDLATVGGRVS
jgi:hypothetical protein